MNYVNGRVASFSRLSEVKEQTEEFEKTPSLKIKRFKYARVARRADRKAR
jgi:long-chain acyl-CoA synthetase